MKRSTISLLVLALSLGLFASTTSAQSGRKQLTYTVSHPEAHVTLLTFSRRVNEKYATGRCTAASTRTYDPAAMQALCAENRIVYVWVDEGDKVKYKVCDRCDEAEVFKSAIKRLNALANFRGMKQADQ